MHITSKTTGDLLEMQVEGMLDNNWADHLSKAIDEVLRQGCHRVALDLSGVTYLSSAGIAVLVKSHKQLQTMHGFFGVYDPSPQVEEVLRLTGLSRMLICDVAQVRDGTRIGRSTMQPMYRVASQAGLDLELFDLQPGQTLRCRTIGNPGLLKSSQFEAQHCQNISFPVSMFGLGLGAFGADFDDCQSRFGEFLAVAGAAAHLPTHGSSTPDYQVAAGTFVPEVKVLYGVTCDGPLAQLIRFEPSEKNDMATLSALVDQCLTMAETQLAGMVIVAETAGLIGASLRRSPAAGVGTAVSRFQHPEIRNWLSFTPERAFSRSLALIVGVAARRPFQTDKLQQRSLPNDSVPEDAARLFPFLRPMGTVGDVHGHFHAAVFSHRPLKKGNLNLQATVATLFESQNLQGVLHLLADQRAISGAGESELVRGGCCIGPIAGISSEDQ